MKKAEYLKKLRQHFVYILRCGDGTFYTGYTVDLKKRLALHNKGRGAKYVRARLPAEIVFAKKYKNYKRALSEERALKTKTRPQKEKLINAFSLKKLNLLLQ